jgi:hypothetical protein
MDMKVSQGQFDRTTKLLEQKIREINNSLLNRLQAEHNEFIKQLEEIDVTGLPADFISDYNNFKANTLRINDVFDANGQFDGSKIKPLTIETGAITVGQRSQQLSLKNVYFSVNPYNNVVNSQLYYGEVTWTGGVMNHYGFGADGMTPKDYSIYVSDTTNNVGSFTLTSTGAYYIYAVFKRVTENYVSVEGISKEYFDSKNSALYYLDSGTYVSAENTDFDESITYYLSKEVDSADTDTTAYILISQERIKVDGKYGSPESEYNASLIPGAGYSSGQHCFYIQIGYISEELESGNTGDNNRFYRKVDMTYGQTTINGRLITTGRIEGNGAYFDLDTGDIGGTIKFKDNNSYISYNDYIDSKISDYNTTLNNTVIKDLKKQVDGAIDTWFYDYMPVHSTSGAPDSTTPLNVVPYKTWNDIDTTAGNNNEKIKHLGDIFYDNTSGYAFRFSNTGTEQSPTFVWETITDSAVIKALADAATAQATADGKLTIFASQPTVDYKIGDLWNNAVYSTETTYSYNGETYNTPYNNVLLVCIRNRVNNTFSITDWIPSDRSIKTADLSLARVEAAKAELLAIENGTTTIAGGMITNNLLELKNIVGVSKQFKNYVSGRQYYKRISNVTSGGSTVARFLTVSTGSTYPNYNLYEEAEQGDINTISGIAVSSESQTTGTSKIFKETGFYYGGGTPGFVTAGLSGIEDFPCYWSGGDEVLARNYINFKKAWDAAPSPYNASLEDYKWDKSNKDFIYDYDEVEPDHNGHPNKTFPVWKKESTNPVKHIKANFITALSRYEKYIRNATKYDGANSNWTTIDSSSDIPRLPVVIIDSKGFCKFGDFYIYNSQVYYNNASGFGHYALTLNGQQNGSGTSLGSFYAPTSPGTNGYILKSNGSGAPSWLDILPVANGGTGRTTTASGAWYNTAANQTSPTIGTLPIAQGGTGQTSQANINKAFIGALDNGTSDVTDGTEFVSSYASDNGFSDSNAINVAYRRSFLKVWNYIKGKMSSDSAVNISGNAATASTLKYNSTINYGAQGLQMYCTTDSENYGTPVNGTTITNPTDIYYYHLMLNYWNTNGYYLDIAAGMWSKGGNIYYRKVSGGTVYDWVKFLDSENYSSYALPRYNSNLTAGYIPKLSTAGQTDLANSILFENSNNIGIGTTSPAYKLDVAGDIKSSTNIRSIGAGEHYVESQNTTSSLRCLIDCTNQQGLWTNGYWNGSSFVSSSLWMFYRTTDGHLVLGSNTETKGNFCATGGVTALQTSSSDKRLKKEIKPFNAKQIIDKLSPVEFEWNKKANKYNSNLELNKKNYGLIAQDSDNIIDNLVFDLPDGNGYKGVRYEKLIPILLQAVKEQQKEIDELKSIVKQLKNK